MDENFIHNMIMEAISIYFETKQDLLKTSKFNVSVTIDDGGPDSRHAYYFQNFKNNTNKYKISLTDDYDTLSFFNISFEDLLKFNIFLNHTDLFRYKYAKGVMYTNTSRNVAEQVYISEFLGASFNVAWNGWDKGGTFPYDRFDCGLLKHGDEVTGPSTVNFKVNVNFANCNFKDEFFKRLNARIARNINSSDLITTIKSSVYNSVISNLKISDNTFDLGEYEWDGSGDQARLTTIKDLANPLNSNWFLHGQCFEKNGLNNPPLISTKNYYNNILGNVSYDYSILDNQINNIKDKLIKFIFNENKYNFVIEYNNSPVFQFPIKINIPIVSDNILKFDKNSKKYITNINTLILDNKNTIKDQYKNDKAFYDNFENVSQKFITQANVNQTNLNDKNSLFKLNSNNELYFDYDFYTKLNKPVINKTEIIPELKDNVDIQYQLNSLIPFYNTLLKDIKNKQPDNFNKILEDQLVSPDDIVVLYKNNVPLNFSYRKYLSNGFNFAANLVENDAIKLLNSNEEIYNSIVSTQIIEPAKVVVIYDLLGNVINPGVELSANDALLTSSDAIFDSAQTIIDNILRTKLVPRDLKKAYYLDENNVYHLVKNEINQIYILTLNNKKYYYPSHSALINELKNYLATVAIKIVYEK